MIASAKLDLVEIVDLTVVVPVLKRFDDLAILYEDYRHSLDTTGKRCEYIFVIDGGQDVPLAGLERLASSGEPIEIVRFNREFGEAACLREGVSRASGRHLLFLPAYAQVAPDAIADLIGHLDDADVVAARRNRRADAMFNRVRGWGFERLTRFAGARYDDPGCMVRAVHRSVFDEIPIQDDKQRFLPLLAEVHGFKVMQLTLPQAVSDAARPQHRPGVYADVMMDLMAVGFLLRFMQRPFRFFGSCGAVAVLCSLVLMGYLMFQREVSNVPLADRPMLVLVVLLMVLGIQIAAIGLIAEIIIFTRGDGKQHYRVEKVVEHVSGDA
ncbi:glycosyltransferase [Sphingobium bisphenolivorans]|uniref:glycosyltransferase n=1 Tax=Sphingobium bisphenolivorans TaxID=1335760 RepID=UPI000399CCC4|nr:glycosyltransferase [Sphingobium bisphenolivorans]